MKTVILPAEDCIRMAAERILSQIKKKENSTIALDAEESVLLAAHRAAALAKESGVSLQRARFFAVCEFEGIDSQDPNSVGRRIREAISFGNDVNETLLTLPAPGHLSEYDDMIELAGGIDLVLLGLGDNARVGFNEPATQFDSNTHMQKLTDKTRRELAVLFGSEENVPSRGMTMGFQQICFARDILVIALGEKKSSAVFHMLYGRDDSVYPAAFLQLPPNVTVYADAAAGGQLEGKSFDAVRFNGD